mmetsp:Transcript_19482/g.34746  ORF Transcript_19482/g.34746 Transcript_19482/m.34746 type:complete len:355 (+) Transcript_19482:385-1449(+)|eukprot:CAMPEP_0184530976 /NCGR_PEP_ID=MMETSP0198_2-20121128/13272_1 /TAXON_ID=1112570 /ORGANISM="Thraustochytrium sp., Strain LLF1b" /LENGTH=354 /DNA_ID=CAMNT_0026923245 /DNA_START=363 /DNA_END=1427 /DNA_ORIENTATION=-
MGNSRSTAEKLNKKLSFSMKKQQISEAAVTKLLLLGAGESGKSTILKQMKLLYGQGFTPEDRFKMRPFLIGNVIEGAIDVFEAAGQVGVTIKSSKARDSGEFLQNLGDRRSFNDNVVKAILVLWNDKDFRNVWEQRSHFQLQDTWHEFIESLKDYPAWGGPDWTPTTEEILRCRVRTTGVVDEQFVVKDIKLRMLDVGGQRNERRKWIHCFEGVTSVIYVASLSEYDQQLFEDSNTNRLVESLELFHEISNSKWFVNSALILFLNKTDLFEEKFLQKRIPLNISGNFPTAPTTFDKKLAYEWFSAQYKEQVDDKSRAIYEHFTCATDTRGVDAVMRASSQHILKLNLKGSGVLV